MQKIEGFVNRILKHLWAMTLDSSTHGEDGVQGSYELPLGMLSLFRVLLPCAILHQESFKY